MSSKILLAELSRTPERQLPAIPNHFSGGHLAGVSQVSWFPDLLEVVARIHGENDTVIILSFFCDVLTFSEAASSCL